MPKHSLSERFSQRAFLRMWFARLFGATDSQMLLVAGLWLKGFPALAQRDRMAD